MTLAIVAIVIQYRICCVMQVKRKLERGAAKTEFSDRLEAAAMAAVRRMSRRDNE